MENKWVKIYYDLIEKLKTSGRPTGIFRKLEIKKHYKNERILNCGWKYNRHHIEEINISGATLKKCLNTKQMRPS